MSNERGTPKMDYCCRNTVHFPLVSIMGGARLLGCFLLPDPSACPSALLPNSLIDLRTATNFGDDQSKSHDMVGVLAPSLFP
jgi:hypothetical protein